MAVQQNKKSASRRGHAPLARLSDQPAARSRAVDRRGAPASPRQPERLLSRQESRQDQERVSRRNRQRRYGSARGARRRPYGRSAGHAPNSWANDVTLAIDCMGGDHGPSVTVPAALRFLERDPARDHRSRRAAGRDRGGAAPPQSNGRASALRVRHATEVVGDGRVAGGGARSARRTRRCASRSISSRAARRTRASAPATPAR